MSESTFKTIKTSILAIPNRPFRIYPLGDQHCSSRGHDAGRYRETLQECRRDPDGHFFFMGDEHDLASFSERRSLRAGDLHEPTIHAFDMMALDKCREFVQQHEWMRGRILFMLQGNHHWVFESNSQEDGIKRGMTSTEWIADKLSAPWGGWLTYCRVQVINTTSAKYEKRKHMGTIDIVASHGKAGGKLVGTPYNQVEELRRIFPGADIYAMGHDHKRGALPDSSLVVASREVDGELVVKQRRQWMVRTGSYLKAYMPGSSDYVVGRLLKPSELGNVKFEVRPSRLRKGGDDVICMDIRCWA